MENDKLFDLMSKMYNDMKDGFKDVNTRLDKVEERLGSVEKRLDKVEQNQVRFEQEVNTKFDALFDGYVQNTESLNRIESKVEYVGE